MTTAIVITTIALLAVSVLAFARVWKDSKKSSQSSDELIIYTSKEPSDEDLQDETDPAIISLCTKQADPNKWVKFDSKELQALKIMYA